MPVPNNYSFSLRDVVYEIPNHQDDLAECFAGCTYLMDPSLFRTKPHPDEVGKPFAQDMVKPKPRDSAACIERRGVWRTVFAPAGAKNPLQKAPDPLSG